MKSKKLVVRFINGDVLKGMSNDFSPNCLTFNLVTRKGELVNIDTDQLKAVFFVTCYEGNRSHLDHYNELLSTGGLIIKVTFYDGECITCATHNYSERGQGFFMTPTDPESNSKSIFVFRAATISIEFLDAVFSDQEFSEKNILKG